MFCRLYIYFKKNKEAPVATASIGVAAFIGAAFPIIWIEIPYLLFGWMPENTKEDRKIASAIACAIIYFCVYFWYKPREKKIITKYEHSKYNDIIPYFVFPLSTFVVFFVALFIEIPIHRWIEDNHYDGIVLRWFLGLFQ